MKWFILSIWINSLFHSFEDVSKSLQMYDDKKLYLTLSNMPPMVVFNGSCPLFLTIFFCNSSSSYLKIVFVHLGGF